MILRRSVEWLRERPLTNWLLVFGYSVFILFAHGLFVDLSVWAMKALSLDVYNRLVALVMLIATIGMFISVVTALWKNPEKRILKIFFFLATLVALVVHRYFLTEMNIEIIHALEFGLLAFLIYPLTDRFGAAVLLGLPVMLIDEWYQYEILFSDYVEYFDFNDVVLDMLGATLVICLLWIFSTGRPRWHQPILRRWELYLLTVITVGTVWALGSCLLAEFDVDSCENTLLVLNRVGAEDGFWRTHPVLGSVYHLLRPMEAIPLVAALGIFVMYMDAVADRRPKTGGQPLLTGSESSL